MTQAIFPNRKRNSIPSSQEVTPTAPPLTQFLNRSTDIDMYLEPGNNVMAPTTEHPENDGNTFPSQQLSQKNLPVAQFLNESTDIDMALSHSPCTGNDCNSNKQVYDINCLKQQGFSSGLIKIMTENKESFARHIWIVDNSGSMDINDGRKLLAATNSRRDVKVVPCTRWSELQECVNYHIQMAKNLNSTTIFRLLNDPGTKIGPQRLSVGEEHSNNIERDVHTAKQTILKSRPGGFTPLTRHIYEVQDEINRILPELISQDKKIAIVLATDGLPTNEQGMGGYHIKEQFVQSLKSLMTLPVWVIVRICTNDKKVVDFYNKIDSELEQPLEVLDDYISEAMEVYRYNKWLNYALPLHRCREMGYCNSSFFDLMDERKLTKTEMKDFCAVIFGDDSFNEVPDPQFDWMGFSDAIQRMLSTEDLQWNPVKNKMAPWIDMRELNKAYGVDKSCSPSCCIM